ncbi:hypothetical protein C4D60_Mb11t20320 [Musa balbisiana]|uniref:Uncharacterized protein n=1 Tax=Musa balbisiana TaxID=52838 RepID=A0A4S8J755_MUSBA|nr:hypothetical protein C4D60_Mb11t20320 [Musa balbisiana]
MFGADCKNIEQRDHQDAKDRSQGNHFCLWISVNTATDGRQRSQEPQHRQEPSSSPGIACLGLLPGIRIGPQGQYLRRRDHHLTAQSESFREFKRNAFDHRDGGVGACIVCHPVPMGVRKGHEGEDVKVQSNGTRLCAGKRPRSGNYRGRREA